MTTSRHRQHDATTPGSGRETHEPWPPARGLLATLTLAGTVPLAVLTTRRAVSDIPIVAAHTTAFSVILGIALTVLAAWTIALAWRTGGLVDAAADVLDVLLFAVSVAALFTHHQGLALSIWVTRLAYSAVTAFPAHPIDHLRHAWWTPVGAYRHGLAHATLDAATHARALLTDPRFDGATTPQLVAVFAHDARAIAADTVGDAPTSTASTRVSSAPPVADRRNTSHAHGTSRSCTANSPTRTGDARSTEPLADLVAPRRRRPRARDHRRIPAHRDLRPRPLEGSDGYRTPHQPRHRR